MCYLQSQKMCQKENLVKLEILLKNKNFSQKSKFWSKILTLVKNLNFGKKSRYWSKIEILVKNKNFGQK